jgi:cytochrome c peroxidase
MRKLTALSLTTALAIMSIGCGEKEKPQNIEKEKIVLDPLATKAIESGLKSIPSDKTELHKIIDNPENSINEAKLELGKMLYFEPRISKSNLISCNTCHNLAIGGDDDVSAATGHKWTANPHHLNSPTVYNAVFADRQFWDGREPDLERQAQGPILAAPEMASSKELVIDTIKSMPEYKSMFKNAFGSDEVTYEKATAAIGAFERTLVTPSRFDDFLNGDATALSAEERKGLETFIDKGCVSCHSGYALGGSMQMFPLVKPFKYANIGDFKGDANGMVKVPTLRNIIETAPYFHNGATWNLNETVKIMGETQLGIDLTDVEINSIVSFLGSLTGEKPEVTYPILPASTSSTPAPDLK